MTRSLPSDLLASIVQDEVKAFFAIQLLFDSPNQLYFWTGNGDLTFDGITYTGTGTGENSLLQISEVRESTDIAAWGATLTMSGIPSALLSLVDSEDYQNRVAKILFGFIGSDSIDSSILLIDSSGDYLIENSTTGSSIDLTLDRPAAMFEVFTGYMDTLDVDEGPEYSTVILKVESKLIDLERPRNRRYTDENQQARYSGDLAFEFVTRLQDESLTWGS